MTFLLVILLKSITPWTTHQQNKLTPRGGSHAKVFHSVEGAALCFWVGPLMGQSTCFRIMPCPGGVSSYKSQHFTVMITVWESTEAERPLQCVQAHPQPARSKLGVSYCHPLYFLLMPPVPVSDPLPALLLHQTAAHVPIPLGDISKPLTRSANLVVLIIPWPNADINAALLPLSYVFNPCTPWTTTAFIINNTKRDIEYLLSPHASDLRRRHSRGRAPTWTRPLKQLFWNVIWSGLSWKRD